MFTYSVTVTLDRSLQEDWIAWMQAEHIPDVMATGCFESWMLQELIDPEPDAGTATFNVQYRFSEPESLERYIGEHAPQLRRAVSERYGSRLVSFRTVLKQLS
ncbi:MAG: DUF4286 family protein [Bacteroidia bacterium]|nr:DUF4286 family protein [Bacteroidia bacterium]